MFNLLRKQQPRQKKANPSPIAGLVMAAIITIAALLHPHSVWASACQSNVVSGNWSAAGSWTNCGGTTPQTVDTVQIQAGHTITIDGSARTIAGLQIDSTGVLANGGFLVTVTGTGTGVSGFTINGTLSGTGGTTLSGAGATMDGSGVVSATGTMTLSANKTVASTANLTIASTIAISTGVTITNNGIVTTTGTSGITGGAASATWTQGTDATLNFGGNTTSLLSTGTLTATATGNTVNYSGTAQTCKVTTYYHLSFSGSGTKTCAATTINGNLTVTGTAAWTMTTIVTVTGNVIVSGGTLTTGAVTFTVTGTTTISAGTLSLTSNTSSKIFVGLVTVSGGTLSGSSTQGVFRGGITQTSGTVSLTGTTTFNTNNQVLTGTISLTTVTVTGVTVTNNGTVTIAGTFSGTGGWTQGTDATVNLGGSTTSAAAITTLTATATGNTVNYYRSGTQTCKTTTYYHLSFAGTSAKTCAATTINGNVNIGGTASWTTGTTALTVTGTTTIAGGTLALNGGTNNKIFVGLVTVSSGTLSGTATVNFFRGGITQTGGTATLTAATFNTNDQDLNGTMSIATVTVTGVTLTNYGTLTASTSITGTGGLVNETTGTINYSASAAPTITTLTSTATGSTFNYTGAGQTCKVMTYYHLGFSGSSAKTCAVTTVDGNLSISGTATWTTTSDVAIGGNLSSGGGTSITTGNFSFSVAGTTSVAGLLHLNGTSSKVLSGLVTTTTGGTLDGNSTTIFFEGGITHSGGSVNINGSSTFTTNAQVLSGTIALSNVVVNSGVTLTNNGALTVGSNISGPGEWEQSASSTLTIAGNLTITTLTASAIDNTITFSSTTGGQTIPAHTYYHLVVAKSGQVATLGGNVVVLGGLTISAGTLDTAVGQNYDITLGGNWANSGTFTARTGIVTLNGSSQQTLSGAMTGTSGFDTLVITNTSGTDDPACGTSFTPGIIFAADATATDYIVTTAGVLVQYLSGGTYTFNDINWNGQSSGTPIQFRNSDLGTGTWLLNVSGTQTDVSYVDVASSDASSGNTIEADNGTNVDCSGNTNWNFAGGTLGVDIVDGVGGTVLSPTVVLSVLSFSFTSQTSTGTLGTSSQKLRVDNATSTPNWTLTIAAGSSGAVWDGAAADFDFNDPTAAAADGADADSVGGQLTINPSSGTITPEGGCTTTGLTLGSSSSFSEGVTDSITLMTAGASAELNCYWDLTGINLLQSIPAEQTPANDYDLDFIVTVTAS